MSKLKPVGIRLPIRLSNPDLIGVMDIRFDLPVRALMSIERES